MCDLCRWKFPTVANLLDASITSWARRKTLRCSGLLSLRHSVHWLSFFSPRVLWGTGGSKVEQGIVFPYQTEPTLGNPKRGSLFGARPRRRETKLWFRLITAVFPQKMATLRLWLSTGISSLLERHKKVTEYDMSYAQVSRLTGTDSDGFSVSANNSHKFRVMNDASKTPSCKTWFGDSIAQVASSNMVQKVFRFRFDRVNACSKIQKPYVVLKQALSLKVGRPGLFSMPPMPSTLLSPRSHGRVKLISNSNSWEF